MIEYKFQKKENKFTENGHTMFESDVLQRLKRLSDLEDQIKNKKLISVDRVLISLKNKNEIYNEAVSFSECNDTRDSEDTKASFIGGVYWLKSYLESHEL